jgi:hypothetical protein
VVRKGASGCRSTGASARCTSQYCLNRISAVSFPTTVPSRSLTFKSQRRSGLILSSFQLHSLRFEQSAHASVGIMHSTAHSKRLQAHEENRRCIALVHCGEHPVLQGVHPIAGHAVVAAACARCGPSSGCAEPSTERRRARRTIVCAHLARRVGSGSAFNGDANRQRLAEAADLGGHTNTQAGSMRRTQPARPHARTPTNTSTPDYKHTVMHAPTHAQARKHPHVDMHTHACECARAAHNRKPVRLHARMRARTIITHQAGCPMNRSRLSLQTRLQKIRRYTWHHAYKAAFACGCILPGLGTDRMISHDMVRRHIPATWHFDLTPHLPAWCRAGRRANRQQSPDNGTGPSK